jgi:hypothetical protein
MRTVCGMIEVYICGHTFVNTSRITRPLRIVSGLDFS